TPTILISLHFSFNSSPTIRYLHSFPTRRSSDLKFVTEAKAKGPPLSPIETLVINPPPRLVQSKLAKALLPTATVPKSKFDAEIRSEEHTSELQSRFDLVCRLLLEKKKKKIKSNN